MNMVRTATICSPMVLMLFITAALGCGVTPPGQESSRNFTVSGFKLALPMVAYTGADNSIAAEAFGIAKSKEAAKAFIERLVMQTVFDVLERQGRSALLPDAVISSILNQLRTQINYDPLECKGATVAKKQDTPIMGMAKVISHCIIVDGTVSALCAPMPADAQPNCGMLMALRNIQTVPTNYMSISGNLTTTNIIMANWSKEMWQRVLNRAIRMLAAGPFASQFFSASATVN
ncbi:hypothetical protein KIN20_024301 [Parelaphostrongylus tenuis]|uniref:Lipoprotein n=1 Tax=Parelaphostrongylus tenuis TaxID=148309 RepID=A0AAD5N7F7_PARTN|nr:hypothetical protein KIN20_024301 [Parelaphostrongylus tenuis]